MSDECAMGEDVSLCAESRCFECGRMVLHKPPGGPQARHWCRLRWLSRRRWAGYLEGWHSGYRFAAENPDDPMVVADREDYGTGWAGWMRSGGALTLHVGDDPPADSVEAGNG